MEQSETIHQVELATIDIFLRFVGGNKLAVLLSGRCYITLFLLNGRFLFRAFLNLSFLKACTKGFEQELTFKQYCGIHSPIVFLK